MTSPRPRSALISGAVIVLAMSLVTGSPARAVEDPTADAASSPSLEAKGVPAKKKARIKTITTRGNVPSGVAFKLSKPVLSGSSLRNRLAFAYKVERFVTIELRRQARAKSVCPKIPRLHVTSKVEAGIYAGRYASIAMVFAGRWCKNKPYRSVRTFTLDLKLQKFATKSDFGRLGGRTRQWAIIDALYRTPAYKKGLLGPKGTTLIPRAYRTIRSLGWTRMPAIEGWRVMKKGMRFYIAAKNQVQVVMLPWARLNADHEMAFGHPRAYRHYMGNGFAGLVAPIPTQLASISTTQTGGVWRNDAQKVSLVIEARAYPPGSTAAKAVGAADAAAASLGEVSLRTLDSKVLTIRGVLSSDPTRRFIIRQVFGATGSVRIEWTYPATASWVEVWAADVAKGIRHVKL